MRLPKDVQPPLSEVRADEERLRSDGCLAFEGVRVPAGLRLRRPKGKVTVALVGDSHAAQWFPALEDVARRRHWRLLTFTKVACPFLDMRVSNVALKREYWECAEFRDRTIARLRKRQPDLVLREHEPVRDPSGPRRGPVDGGPGRCAGSGRQGPPGRRRSCSRTRPTPGATSRPACPGTLRTCAAAPFP